MKVNICGLEHDIIECEEMFDKDLHMGQIDYDKCQIKINKQLAPQLKDATLCHEIMHGVLIHIGREDLSYDEQFMTALGNAVNQTFCVKKYDY